MEVHRQTCQSCGSIKVTNVLVREPGRAQKVFVVCAACKELVARYRLEDYYHHGKGIESFLRSRASLSTESGRDTLEEFEEVQADSEVGLERALKILKDAGKEI